MLRAGLRRRRGAAADLPRPPRDGPDDRSRDAAQRRRRPRHAARLRRRGHRRDSILLIGHSAGAYYAQAMAARRPAQVAGLALVCPLLPDVRDVPEHRVVVGSGEIGDDVFRSYFVIQTPEMLERYERYVAPAADARRPGSARADRRTVGAHPDDHAPAYAGPTLVVAGRLDSTVGYAAAADLVDQLPARLARRGRRRGTRPAPRASPRLLRALVAEWLARVERSG